jgi:SLT domain-containing protein
MNQGINMDALNRTRQTIQSFWGNAQHITRAVRQQWTGAFTAIQGAVAHGLMQFLRQDMRGWKTIFQGLLNAGLTKLKVFF